MERDLTGQVKFHACFQIDKECDYEILGQDLLSLVSFGCNCRSKVILDDVISSRSTFSFIGCIQIHIKCSAGVHTLSHRSL